MNYQETLDWMFSKLPMYQRQGKTAFKKDLTNILAFSKQLGHPEEMFKSIHVAGTNGKGSTSHMMASILQQAGYKVGLYTSPHLKDFRERIKINGEMISEETVIEFIDRHHEFLDNQGLSFFEMTVGMAFDFFATQSVDVALIEVGLGGRLDSTNIISPELSIITNIGYDHMQFLGETLPEIAYEKAGIIKPGIPVIIGEKHEETTAVFESIARERQALLHWAEAFDCNVYTTDLIGDYQKKNIQTALAGFKLLKGFEISDEDLRDGFQNVVNNTGLQGRWQVLSETPKVVCDTAHNKEGLDYVLRQLGNEQYNRLHIVLGTVNDKKLETILPLFPKAANYYFCRPNIPRGLASEILTEKAAEFGRVGVAYATVKEAYAAALKQASNDDFIFVGGSTFVVAEVL